MVKVPDSTLAKPSIISWSKNLNLKSIKNIKNQKSHFVLAERLLRLCNRSIKSQVRQNKSLVATIDIHSHNHYALYI